MNENNVSEPCSGSFASEFEKYLNSGHLDELKVGNIVEGTVVAVSKETVSVDIGFKSSGVIRVAEFADINGKVPVKCGDKVDVMIVTLENESNQIVLSREKAYQKKIWDAVENAFKNDEILHGRIVQKVKGGLQVDIGIPAFLPGSQIDIRPHRNLDKFLGEEFDFKVLKITKEKGNIVLSRRAVLMSERDQLRGETLKVLSEGVVMEGTVKNITDYGAFIDLGGIDGLLHITDISWGRVNHPAEMLSVGQVVPVVVLKYDPEKVSYRKFSNMIRKYQPHIKTCSVMPKIDVTAYEYQPEEAVTISQFMEVINEISQEDQDALLEDISMEHMKCESGACPI